MPMFEAAELAELRAEWEAEFLTDSVVITRIATSAGSGLSVTSTPTPTPVAARVDPAQVLVGRDAKAAAQLSQEDRWLVRLPVGTSVQQDDTLTWRGKTLKVTRLLAPRSEEIVMRVVCSERS